MKTLAAALTLALLAVSPAMATTVNLTNPGDQAVINGALFYLTDPNPTGTGTIQSFLRIQHNGSEEGYNTDVDNQGDFQFDEKYGNFTHSITLESVGRVSFDGGQTYYREFMLDAAESDGYLVLTDLKLYLEPVGNLLDWPDSFGDPLWDLDTATADNTVNLTIQPGNGRGDLYIYIPDSLFADDPDNPYLYLYSRFENTSGSFEEWSTQATPDDPDQPPVVPEPMTLSLLGLGLGLGALMRRRITR